MNEQEFRDSWALVSERFGDKAEHDKLISAAKNEYKVQGRGVISLGIINGLVATSYIPLKALASIIDEGGFRDRLLSTLQNYNPTRQAIVLVSFDDMNNTEVCNYEWYGLGIN